MHEYVPPSADDPILTPAERAEFSDVETHEALTHFDRRSFLKLATASAALATGVAGFSGCTRPQPPEKIVPTVKNLPPDQLGNPLFFATALPRNGFAYGALVEQRDGRPTKIEGNDLHPSTLGASDLFMQASILQLYDPNRSRTIVRRSASGLGVEPASWESLAAALRTFLPSIGSGKKRVRLLTPTLTSPTLAAQIEQLRSHFPGLRWHRHDGIGMTNRQEGLRRAAGRDDLTPVYSFLNARRIVSLDSHFLADEPGSVRYIREFVHRRRQPFHAFGPTQTHRPADAPAPEPLTPAAMTRLYVAECDFTYTGAMADHRLAVTPAQIPALAAALAGALTGSATLTGLPQDAAAWIAAAAADLRAAGPNALVLVGETQPPEIHAIAHAANAFLHSTAVRYVQRVDYRDAANPDDSLPALLDAIKAGDVDLLLLLDVNPAYTATADLGVADILQNFSGAGRLSLHLGQYADETAALCDWHVPLSHALEAWGDARGHDGTASIIQPLIEPLWHSKSAVEVLDLLLAAAENRQLPLGDAGYDIVRRHWLGQWSTTSSTGTATASASAPATAPATAPSADLEMRWRRALHDGIISDTASAEVTEVAAAAAANLPALVAALPPPAPRNAAIQIAFRPDPALSDGDRGLANHPWLQELPRPISHLTWDNPLLISPTTAAKLGIDSGLQAARGGAAIWSTGHVGRLAVGSNALEFPLWVQPGLADGVAIAYLGGGRRSPGVVQESIGVNVNLLRTRNNSWSASATLSLTGATAELATTQPPRGQEDRDIARMHSIQSPTPETSKPKKVILSLYGEFPYDGYKWAMTVNLSACVGCLACVVACQAENNIPTVGKWGVLHGREMHWIRIDAYTQSQNPQIRFQPMMCQHCEEAPCEVVCPVGATTHSDEGLNEMTYNRCVGTRYCSNNCPYKVRRFNFFQYNNHDVATWNMQKNPDVTVRSRGVMEKCTYCVQRLNRAKITAERDRLAAERRGRSAPMHPTAPDAPHAEQLPRIAVQTACQQACPAEALIFGDLNDSASFAGILRRESPWHETDYAVLEELTTKPRTHYLERLINPNPRLSGAEGEA